MRVKRNAANANQGLSRPSRSARVQPQHSMAVSLSLCIRGWNETLRFNDTDQRELRSDTSLLRGDRDKPRASCYLQQCQYAKPTAHTPGLLYLWKWEYLTQSGTFPQAKAPSHWAKPHFLWVCPQKPAWLRPTAGWNRACFPLSHTSSFQASMLATTLALWRLLSPAEGPRCSPHAGPRPSAALPQRHCRHLHLSNSATKVCGFLKNFQFEALPWFPQSHQQFYHIRGGEKKRKTQQNPLWALNIWVGVEYH